MRYYPLFVNMDGARCLLVGAGEVGCRKLADLLLTELAEILVLDVAPASSRLDELGKDARVRFERRAFMPEDVQGRRLVFAATPDPEVNASVLDACQKNGVFCNCADAPEKSGFIVPSKIRKGRIWAALSTQGGSPALARRLREEMETHLENGFAPLAEVMARLRPLTLALRLGTRQNTELFRRVVYSPLHDALNARDRTRCEVLLRELLPESLHSRIEELLYELC